MASSSGTSIIDRAKRAGCWAVALYVFAAFFALGGLISLVNADIMLTVEGLLLAALCVGGGIWLARRAARGGSTTQRAADFPSTPNRPRPRSRSQRR